MNRNKIIKIIPYILAIFVFFSLSNVSKLNNTEYFASNTFLNEAEKMEFKDVTVSVGNVIVSVSGKYVKEGKDVVFSATVPNTDTNIEWLQVVLNEGTNKVTVKA